MGVIPANVFILFAVGGGQFAFVDKSNYRHLPTANRLIAPTYPAAFIFGAAAVLTGLKLGIAKIIGKR